MTATVTRVDIDLDRAQSRRAGGPPWLAVLVAVVVTAVLTMGIIAHTDGRNVAASIAAPAVAPAHALRMEVAGDGDGQLRDVTSTQLLTIGAPGVVVLTVRSRGGQAWCRIYVDEVLTVEQAADAGSTATCTWWSKS